MNDNPDVKERSRVMDESKFRLKAPTTSASKAEIPKEI